MLQIELTEGDCVNGSAGCKMGEAVAGSLGPGEERCEACPPALPCSPSGRHVQVSHRPCCPRVSDKSGPRKGLGRELGACHWGPPGSSLCGRPPRAAHEEAGHLLTAGRQACSGQKTRPRGDGGWKPEARVRRPTREGNRGAPGANAGALGSASARPPRASPRGSSEWHSRLLSEERRAYRA